MPFLCECGDPACGEFVRLTLPEYAEARRLAAPLVSPGHDGAGQTLVAAS